MRFAGMTAAVTGAGRGIGARISERLLSEGATVARLDVASSYAGDDRGWAQVVDVSSEPSVRAAFAEIGSRWDRLDFLVNCAGIEGPVAPLEQTSLDGWRKTLDVNLTGMFLCCREAIPLLRRSTGKAIVNIASVTGKRPLVRRAPYAASKLGVIGLTRTLAAELGPDNIRVNAVSPSGVEGERLEAVVAHAAEASGRDPESVRDAARRQSPLGRFVTVDDVAHSVLFLLSSEAAALTGQDLNVSAGAVMY